MSNRNPDIEYDNAPQSLPFVIFETFKEVLHTAMPGVVVSYDAETKRAVVQPGLRTVYVYTDDRAPTEVGAKSV